MRRHYWYHFVALSLLIPGPVQALGLRWSGGEVARSVSVATRCTLEVFVDGDEALPNDWRLLWSADSCELVPIPIESSCGSTVAEVTALTRPTDMFGLLENRLDAHFCSAGIEAATIARYTVDIPALRRGAFRVVALDPADPDSSHVLESPVVSFNDGSGLELPPVILRASITHQSTDYVVEVVGAGLSGTESLRLFAPDRSWEYALAITGVTDTSIAALGSIAAVVPASVLQAETDSGFTASIHLPAEAPPALESLDPLGASCQVDFRELLLGPNMLQPKDFALVPGGWTPEGEYVYHLFYIRQNYATATVKVDGLYLHGGPDSTENKIGHAVSNDLLNWCWLSLPQVGEEGQPNYRARCQPAVPVSNRDTMAIHSRAGKFDSKHVWAPSIVRRGLTYYMFYTGVDAAGDQRMGLATSTDLFNWTQRDEPVFRWEDLGNWARPQVQQFGFDAQFRDPFVMADPANPGGWLMYFVTVPDQDHGATVVGVAQSDGDLTQWDNDRPLYNTLRAPDPRAESPHAFFSQGQWRLFYTSSHDPEPADTVSRWGVYAQSNPTSPTDELAANWSPQTHVDTLIWDEYRQQPTDSYFYWKGSEYLHFNTANDVQFMAAYNDQTWGISITRVGDTSLPALFVERCGFNWQTGVDEALPNASPHLEVTGLRFGRAEIHMEIAAPQATEATITVHDLAGRAVRRLFRGRIGAGRTPVSWDGRGNDGSLLRQGIYFARLSTPLGSDSVRIPILR